MSMAATTLDQVRLQTMLTAIAVSSSPASWNYVVPGPEMVVLFGVPVPALSALTGIVGVGLGHLLAPVPAAPLTRSRRAVLLASMVLLIVGVVIATGQNPVVAISWGIGLGFSALAVAQTLGTGATTGIKALIDVVIAIVTARAGGSKGKDQ